MANSFAGAGHLPFKLTARAGLLGAQESGNTLSDEAARSGDNAIDGIAVAMTPSPFAPHERVVSRLARTIGNHLESIGSACEVDTGLDWIVSEYTVVRPELMAVCGEQPEEHLRRTPQLVVEVLSESTRGRDLVVKRALYCEQGVSEYWIVDPDNQTIEVCRGESSTTDGREDILELLPNLFKEASIKLSLASVFPKS